MNQMLARIGVVPIVRNGRCRGRRANIDLEVSRRIRLPFSSTGSSFVSPGDIAIVGVSRIFGTTSPPNLMLCEARIFRASIAAIHTARVANG